MTELGPPDWPMTAAPMSLLMNVIPFEIMRILKSI